MFKKISCIAILIVITNHVFAHDYTLGQLVINHPYTRATSPQAKIGGAFIVSIKNNGDIADKLISITNVSFADSVQIHETKMEDNVMKMRELKEGLTIPAKSMVELKPGGYHIMFMNLKDSLVSGQKYKATLNFEKAGSINIEFETESFKDSGHMMNMDRMH
jgi:periplasmic copper chaperone A